MGAFKRYNILFSHRTFSWTNEARGKAAVHCVILRYGLQNVASKIIYECEYIKGELHSEKPAISIHILIDVHV